MSSEEMRVVYIFTGAADLKFLKISPAIMKIEILIEVPQLEWWQYHLILIGTIMVIKGRIS